jgi:hypothetical protein
MRRVATLETMANTYTSLHYHIVFSTENRELWIKPELEDRVWTYLGGILGFSDQRERIGPGRAAARIGWRPCRPVYIA